MSELSSELSSFVLVAASRDVPCGVLLAVLTSSSEADCSSVSEVMTSTSSLFSAVVRLTARCVLST